MADAIVIMDIIGDIVERISSDAAILCNIDLVSCFVLNVSGYFIYLDMFLIGVIFRKY